MNRKQESRATLSEILDTARNYVGRGWVVLRIPYKQKGPITEGRQTLRLTANELPPQFDYAKSPVATLACTSSRGWFRWLSIIVSGLMPSEW